MGVVWRWEGGDDEWCLVIFSSWESALMSSSTTSALSRQPPTRLMKDARVRGSVPHVGLPAKLVDRGGHGKWVVDAGQGRDHGKVRQGVHQGVEEGQGMDP